MTDDLHADTSAAYERASSAWPSIRRDAGETPWLQRLASHLPPGGHVLDLGCGSGEPVSGWLLRHGFAVTGVDVASGMIAHARAAHPGAEWVVADMRELPELGRFDGVLSWDGSFHLSREEQRLALPRFADLVRPGGALMLTVGPEDGEVTGTVGEETVYHASLSRETYVSLLAPLFARVTHEAFDGDVAGRYVLMATGKKEAHPRWRGKRGRLGRGTIVSPTSPPSPSLRAWLLPLPYRSRPLSPSGPSRLCTPPLCQASRAQFAFGLLARA